LFKGICARAVVPPDIPGDDALERNRDPIEGPLINLKRKLILPVDLSFPKTLISLRLFSTAIGTEVGEKGDGIACNDVKTEMEYSVEMDLFLSTSASEKENESVATRPKLSAAVCEFENTYAKGNEPELVGTCSAMQLGLREQGNVALLSESATILR